MMSSWMRKNCEKEYGLIGFLQDKTWWSAKGAEKDWEEPEEFQKRVFRVESGQK